MHPYRDSAAPVFVQGPRVMRVMAFFDGACIALEHLEAGEYSIGHEAGVSMFMDGSVLPGPRFPLVRHERNGWVLRFTSAMAGTLGDACSALSLSELSGRDIAMPDPERPAVSVAGMRPDGSARISIGRVTFEIASIPKPVRHSLRSPVDWSPFKYAAASATVFALLLFMVFSIPSESKPIEPPFLRNVTRFVCTLTSPPPGGGAEPVPAWLRKDADKEGRPRWNHSNERCRRRQKSVLRQQIYLYSALLGVIPVDNGSVLASLYRELEPPGLWRRSEGLPDMGLHDWTKWDDVSCTCNCLGCCDCLPRR